MGALNAQPRAGRASHGRLYEAAWALFLAAALTNCHRATELPSAAAAAIPVATGRTMEIILRRFECEERCWLEVELPDGSVLSGWCNAPVCAHWLDNGMCLPADLVGRRARIKLRQQKVSIGTQEDRIAVEDIQGITLLLQE